MDSTTLEQPTKVMFIFCSFILAIEKLLPYIPISTLHSVRDYTQLGGGKIALIEHFSLTLYLGHFTLLSTRLYAARRQNRGD